MILHSYWRSTTSYRVRMALNLKGVAYDLRPVDLVAGDQRSPGYVALNPVKGVPTLVLDDGTVLTQSLAIIDYLDATHPQPPLLSGNAVERAHVLAAALVVATDIHPVNNLKVLAELTNRFGADADARKAWMLHWMTEGFSAIEALVRPDAAFAFGDRPTLADLCVTAQAYNARRWGLSLDDFPAVARIEAACLALPQIAAAHPDRQPDAKETA